MDSIQPEQHVRFLPQDIEPTPLIQLTQDGCRAEFTISDQKSGGSGGNQFTYISQQSQLFPGTALAFDVLDPGPGKGDSPFSIGQTHDQQLMPETNLGAIHNQIDFTQVPELSFQPHPGDGFVPFPHSNGGISQQSAQSPGRTHQLGLARDLAGYAAQTDREALVDANDQPNEVENLGNALAGTQFLNPLEPGMIERVGRHGPPPVSKFCCRNYFNRSFSANQLSFC